jgi:hypothetical protein
MRYWGVGAMPWRTGSVRRILARLRSSADRRVLFEAALLLPVVSLGLRALGWRRVQQLLGRGTSMPARRSLEEARHVSALVEATARRSPIPYNCLQRSVVLWRVLRRRQLEADLRLGVRKETAGGHRFHAWVEHGGEVLNDVQGVRDRYSVFGAQDEVEHPS